MRWSEGLWPHQLRALEDVVRLHKSGVKRIVVVGSCGAGKSRMMGELLSWAGCNEWRGSLYTGRKLLAEQTSRKLTELGLAHGIRAAGFPDNRHLPLQVSSIQTESSRVGKRGWEVHDADIVLVDEIHMNKEQQMMQLLARHTKSKLLVGFTATPLNLGHIVDVIVDGGMNSELRACKAHLPCMVFAPDEPDIEKVRKTKTSEYKINGELRSIFTQNIVGPVVDNYLRLNPMRHPAVLFGSCVGSSMWWVDRFGENGISAAHLDGKNVYLGEKTIDGEPVLYEAKSGSGVFDENGRELSWRDRVLAGAESGEFSVLCNRFVLREGWDMPRMYHAILATAFDSIQSYLQSVGRVQRYHPDYEFKIIQDHGCNFWRFGSPNADRNWYLHKSAKEYEEEIYRKRVEQKEPEPITCPQCFAIRLSGPRCHNCGFQHTKRLRNVIQEDGSIEVVDTPRIKQKTISTTNDPQKMWDAFYYPFMKSGRTFLQARGAYFKEHGSYPDYGLNNMPISRDPMDWKTRIKDMPRDQIRSAK